MIDTVFYHTEIHMYVVGSFLIKVTRYTILLLTYVDWTSLEDK